MALLEARNITKYFGGLAALSDLDIDVYEGEILGLIGPNGAGKTTLFNVITGFLSPTRGKIYFKGEDITGLRPDQIATRGIVRTFQATTFFPMRTVLGNVITGHYTRYRTGFWQDLLNTASVRRETQAVVKSSLEILETLGLAHLKTELAGNLPYGYQKVLGVAIALAAQPRLLLLDEPVTGLNVQEVEVMMQTIKRLRERGLTIMIVEHNMRAVMGTCERIVVLNFGRKIAEGSPGEIRENKAVIEAYLGVEES